MTNVAPPPQLKIPKDFLADPEKRNYFQQKDFLLYQLWLRTGGGSDTVANDSIQPSLLQAQLTELISRIGSGDALTSDETGFTVDSDRLTVDMDES